MSTTVQPRLTDEPGVRFGIANGLLVGEFLGTALVGFDHIESEFAAVLAAGLVSVGLPVAMTASIGVTAWALFTGFVENDYGQLTLGSGDLARLAAFTLATLALAVLTRRTYEAMKENAHA